MFPFIFDVVTSLNVNSTIYINGTHLLAMSQSLTQRLTVNRPLPTWLSVFGNFSIHIPARSYHLESPYLQCMFQILRLTLPTLFIPSAEIDWLQKSNCLVNGIKHFLNRNKGYRFRNLNYTATYGNLSGNVAITLRFTVLSIITDSLQFLGAVKS